jgi:hypothetical protein
MNVKILFSHKTMMIKNLTEEVKNEFYFFLFNEFYSVGTACTKVHIMVAHTSKLTEIMSDRCAGVCKELIVHFILYFIHGQTLRTGT